MLKSHSLNEGCKPLSVSSERVTKLNGNYLGSVKKRRKVRVPLLLLCLFTMASFCFLLVPESLSFVFQNRNLV